MRVETGVVRVNELAIWPLLGMLANLLLFVLRYLVAPSRIIAQAGNDFVIEVEKRDTCHEFGHQLGLPDLYDTTPDQNGNSQGLGAWDIMATGVWNANGYVPAEPD